MSRVTELLQRDFFNHNCVHYSYEAGAILPMGQLTIFEDRFGFELFGCCGDIDLVLGFKYSFPNDLGPSSALS